MTKVLLTIQILVASTIWLVPYPMNAASTTPVAAEKPAENLYLQLGEVGLDPSRVYLVRGASFSRGAIQISLEDGTIGFTQDVMGHITGAFFEGEGELLLLPPNEVERRSMSLFTGMAILEERFATAYFRFNDDLLAELRADLRDAENKDEFTERWNATAKNMASTDAMRLLLTFSRMLPTSGNAEAEVAGTSGSKPDRFLHARVQGLKLGVFDVFFDSTAAEQVFAGQSKAGADGESYYDVWTSFSLPTAALRQSQNEHTEQEEGASAHDDKVALRKFAITTEVLPPKQIRAKAVVQCEVREGGARTLLFELSRFLLVESVQLNGKPIEFIHNPALEGSELARRGNDVMAVIVPWPLKAGQQFELTFIYSGEVLAQAGDGLLYVGARGTWYPNRGLEMANFDLQFSYPQGWTLVATGKQAPFATDSIASASGEQTSRWISDRLIPVAGFNLGKYRQVNTKAGGVQVETYATQGVEQDFPRAAQMQLIEPARPNPTHPLPQLVLPTEPPPALNEVLVGEAAARAVQYFSERFGPYPYSHLALTQLPGRESQGWPSLIFLSSYAFLDRHEREQLHFPPPRMLLVDTVPAHETAHQWWGDLITWSSYRDQWYSEGLANYCALMMLQEKNPEGFRQIMEMYRRELVEKNKDGVAPMDAGPVTLGTRLLSSHFPRGYDAISYGRGAWIFHMLRTMLNDAAKQDKKADAGGKDELFIRALHKVRRRYEGRMISTRELLDTFAEDLPSALRYEGKQSLDWFLDGWVNGTSLPSLELKGVKSVPKGSESIVSGTILQKDAPQELVTSVPVYAVMGKQLILLGRVFADGEESSFRLSAPAGAHKIVLDPYETVLTRPK
ncbi:MAG TPA: M1 family aminopeptidase [Candidatus Sulfotelmatobacter sp.]|nr:M1 family aminopeptidase [Candidatus Sulfotelmatobacter sp.]